MLHLKVIPDVILSNTSLSIKQRWPIKEAIKIVRRISSTITDMHNAQYVEQKQPKNCYNNQSKKNIRAKKFNEPQYKFTVGSSQFGTSSRQ